MIKLAVLLKRKKGMSFEEFDSYWEGPHGDLVCSIPEFTRHVRRYSQSHLADSTYTGEGMTWGASGYDGIAEVWYDNIEDLTNSFNEPKFVDLVGADDPKFIDSENISVLVTNEVEKIPLNGNPKIKLSVVIKRKKGMSFDEFDNYWIGRHAEVVMSVPEFTRYVRRYVQSHLVSDYTGQDDNSKLTKKWGLAAFDGIAELWFDSIEDMTKAFNEPRFIEIVAPDDGNFVDHTGTKLFVLHEVDKIPFKS